MNRLLTWLLSLALLTAGARAATISNNQTIVWLGDSIYHPVQASAYVESFFQFNFPTNKLRFRNVCHPGSTMEDWQETTDTGGPHLTERWVLPWKPQVVLSVVGYNNIYTDTNRWFTNHLNLFPNYVVTSNRVLNLITNTGVILVEPMGRNTYDGYPMALCHPWWITATGALGYAENIEMFISVFPYVSNEINQAMSPSITNLYWASWDNHPTASFEVVLANRILRGLNLSTNISSATIDASTGTSNVTDCLVSNVVVSPRAVTFQRYDFKLPMAWDQTTVSNDLVRDAFVQTNLFSYHPDIIDGQRHMLTVTNLAAGQYVLGIDGSSLATLSSTQLAAGFNLTWLNAGSYYTQRLHMINLIRDKEGRSNSVPKTVIAAHQGVHALKVASDTEYSINNKRGTNLVAALQDEADATKVYDTNIWNAAIGQWRTFSISMAQSHQLSGKLTLGGKVASQ